MAEEIHVCEADDPNRCQAMTAKGQCRRKGAELPRGQFATYCRIHNGNMSQLHAQKDDQRTYIVAKFQSELDSKRRDPNIKNLRDDVAVLRFMLETKLNSCQTKNDLLLNIGPITELTTRIQSVVTACHKLDTAMGQYLDKQQVVTFAGEVIDVVSKYVSPDILKNIVADLQSAIWRIENAVQTDDDTD